LFEIEIKNLHLIVSPDKKEFVLDILKGGSECVNSEKHLAVRLLH